MPTTNTLLTVRQGEDGTFGNWLEKVGLKDFIKRYPIPKLVEWGWLVPQKNVESDECYFHWQAYVLIDMVRFADCILHPVINTPDIEQQAQNIVQIAEQIKSLNPASTAKRQWIELAEPMTWLSHYRSLRNALHWNEDAELKRERAKQLADYLQIDDAILERFIKEKLLVLAQDWLWANEQHDCVWTRRAWSELQIDVANAVEWLCSLNGKTFRYYFDIWQYQHYQREEWAELHKVLPFEFFENQKCFLEYAPIYLSKNYKGILPTGEEFKQLVNDILNDNDYFHNLLSAFNQLHKQLEQKNSLDFREYRPLDYYSLLAIRAEDCLRYKLEEDGSLQNIDDKKQSLRSYIIELSKQNNIAQQVISRFESDVKNLTQLREKPSNPISRIMEMKLESYSKNDARLIKAFLCCNLARNYFAHHTYLDEELIRSEESAFMLGGILVTVLTLLKSAPLEQE